jgi:acetyltransferase-like isoleucine patch superfamily enzyme
MNLFKYFNYLYLRYMGCIVEKDIDIRGLVYIKNKGSISIGSSFICNSGLIKNPIGGDTIARFVVRPGGSISIGNNVGISNSTIVSSSGVIINDNVLIGGGCRIWDTNFHSLDSAERKNKKEIRIKSKKIILKESCFIGAGSIILPGVTIGQKSIIGAGSVVRDNVPDNEIWVGNPAIKLRDVL